MSPFSSSVALAPDPVSRELEAGERLLWSGMPEPARMKRKAIPVALFSIPMGAFIAFWIWGASAAARSMMAAGQTPTLPVILFPAFGLIFVGVVVALALSPWTEESKARRTYYGLTDRRALIVVEGKGRKVKSVLPPEFLLERRDLGSGGDLVLKREITGSGKNRRVTEYGFFGIENHHEVERLALELKQGLRR